MRSRLFAITLSLLLAGALAASVSTRGGQVEEDNHRNGEPIQTSDDTVLLAADLTEEPPSHRHNADDEGIRPQLYETEPVVSASSPPGFRFRTAAHRNAVHYSNDRALTFTDDLEDRSTSHPRRHGTPELDWDMTKRQVEIATMGLKDLFKNVDHLRSNVADHAFKNDWSFLQFQDQVNKMDSNQVLRNMQELQREREELLRAKNMIQLELKSKVTSKHATANRRADSARAETDASAVSVDVPQYNSDLPSDDHIRELADVDHVGETLEWEDLGRVKSATTNVDTMLAESAQVIGRLKNKYDDKARLYQ